MRRFPIRWGLFAAAVLTFCVGTVAVFPTPSYASVPSITSMGGPVNVLPSAVDAAATAATTGTSISRADYVALMMYKASKSPEFWALYAQAQKTAASTGKPLALTADVASEATTIYPAASKIAPLVKGAGTVGAAISAYQMTTQLTNGLLNLVGMDATGKVCTGTGSDLWGKVVQVAAGVYDCSAYDQMDPDYKPNTDAEGGTSWGQRCVNGLCVSLGSSAVAPDNAGYFAKRAAFTVNCTTSGPAKCGTSDVVIWYDTSETTNQATQVLPRSYYESDSTDVGKQYRTLFEALGSPDYGGEFYRVPTRWTLTDGSYPSQDGWDTPTTTSADPQRTIKCVIAGSDGNTYQATSEQFKESAGALPGIKCADLPPGVMPTTTTLTETGGDSGDQTIWDAQTPQAVTDALTKYGECGTTSVCPLVLEQDGKSCFDAADCTGWSNDADQSRYTCKYGSYSVSMSECAIYKNRWEPAAQTSGDTLTDPTTGDPLKNPKPELSPGSTANAGSTSADNATDLGTNNCFKNMAISLNPISWVVEPFKCMFIPRDGYTDQIVKQYQSKADASYPAKLAATIGALNFKGPGSGCSGIPIHMGVAAIPDFTIMAACPGDMLAPAAGYARVFLDLGISVVGLLAITKFVGSAFGFTAFGSKGGDDE